MGWNGSGGGAAPQKPKVTAKKPSPVRGLIAGLVVVVAAVVCYFAFFSKSEKPSEKKPEKKPSKIAEVTPAAPTNAVKPKVAKKIIRRKVKGGYMDYTEDGKPMWLYPRVDPDHTKYGITTSSVATANFQLQDKIFHNSADLQLAYLALAVEGDEVGTAISLKTFTKTFLEAIKTPIKIEPDDSERARELKQAVIELRTELKKRYDAGEDIAAVVEQTRNELVDLAAYKKELLKSMDEFSRDEKATEKDMEDYLKAANEMLEKKGIGPMSKLPTAIRSRVRIHDRKRQKQQQEQGKENQ